MLTSWCDSLAGWMDRRGRIAALLFSVLFVAVTGFLAATKPMNFDEIATYYPAREKTATELWSFFAQGLDTNTPMVALLVRGSITILGDNHLAVRLPMILGYCLLCWSIYEFVAFRCSQAYGLAAMLLPPVTSVYFYATEARAYGVVLGISAFALVCWQRASSAKRGRLGWLIGLWASLGFCIMLHYFTLLLWVPLGCAELVRAWQNRKIDWPIAAVLATGLAPLAFFLPMMQAARQNYMGGFWARPRFGDIENTYRFMLTLAFAPLLGTLLVWLVAPLVKRTQSAPGEVPPPPLSERILISVLALTPLYAVPPLMLLRTTAFVPRYVLFTLTGITILIATAAFRRSAGDSRIAIVAVMCLGAWFLLKYPAQGRRQMVSSGGLPFRAAQPYAAEPWTRAMEQDRLPIAISPAIFYLPFQHYSPPALRERTFYLTSIGDALRLDGTDTGDRGLLAYSRRYPLQVPGYQEFVQAHPEFLLCAETTNPTWVIEKLLEDHADLQLILRQGTYFLYRVTMPRAGAAEGTRTQ